MLKGKKVVLGVTGSIAAYKAVDLASKLTQAGAEVDVIMTRAATQFVTPLSFRSLTHCPVVTDMFDLQSQWSVEHVALAQRADVVVIAPASANTIAKLAAGLADEMLTSTVLATRAPVLLAPAMNTGMYENPITQENLAKLKARGFAMVGPAYGHLAEGGQGLGRMAEVEEIMGAIRQVLGRKGDLAGYRLVVSAGATQEPLDPVRHLTNRSTGKMGYAIAEAARDRGASVVLVSGPASLSVPVGVEVVSVRTAQEMRDAVAKATSGAHALIMAAAVADYRPETSAVQKLKKGPEAVTLKLVRTPDILEEVRGDFVRVGFAAESERVVENAREKLVRKGLDFIVANNITASDSGFGTDTNRCILIDRWGGMEELPLMLKSQVAERILDRVREILSQPSGGKGNAP